MENVLKRRQESDDNEQSLKRPKPMEPAADDQENEEIPLKLDDLNDYCLEDIFKYLQLGDLLNLAEVSDRFVCEAKRAARRKFRESYVKISDTDISIGNEGPITFGPFAVHKLLTFFELFGADISTLTINYYENSEEDCLTYRIQLLEYLIIKHCSQTLVRLELLGLLEFKHEIFVHTNKRFAALQHLEIGINDEAAGPNPNNFEIDDIKAIIRVNPQIHTLRFMVNDCLTEDFWQFINEHAPQLEHLELRDVIDFDFYNGWGWAMMEYMKEDQKLVTDHVPRFFITNLKELEIYDIYIEEFHDGLLEFVCKNRNLMKLKILIYENSEIIHEEAITMLIRNLPKLTELTLYDDDINVDGIVRFLVKCDSLQVLRLKFRKFVSNETIQEYMNASIGTNWKLLKETDELLTFIR